MNVSLYMSADPQKAAHNYLAIIVLDAKLLKDHKGLQTFSSVSHKAVSQSHEVVKKESVKVKSMLEQEWYQSPEAKTCLMAIASTLKSMEEEILELQRILQGGKQLA